MPQRKERGFEGNEFPKPFSDVGELAKTLETVQLRTQIVRTEQKPRLPGRKQRGFVLPAIRRVRSRVEPASLMRHLVTQV